ncbi:hypothetical protein SAMN04489712_105279 [Thermomonospora echinospora]|uniref:Uncharacterized protein n=1 Tax=Thermomonospora echinospora TaxID=1992 RepID=A0A1H6A9R5_9ACTN|nr:hypothetical protein [Thermomonospora echinospora]SEG44944.1 hypothetical protein SAMN04489712_105279 [Thermomonospora echinospora]
MEVHVRHSDLRELGRDFRAAGRRDLSRDMLKEMRGSVKPIVPQLRSALRGSPSRTGDQRTESARQARPRGLRDAMARGVQTKASLAGPRVGVRLRIDPRHFPDKQKSLPKYREGVLPRWRSPNWGRDEWKQQQSHPVFFPTIRPHIPRVQRDLRRIVDEYVDRVARETDTPE